jgi:hypothetical protein
MISALGTIPYGGIGVAGLIFVAPPDPTISRSIDGTQYTLTLNPEGKSFEVFRASGQLGLFESIGIGYGATFVDTVPNPNTNYIYRFKWILSSPFISIRSKDYYTIQAPNIS